MVFLMTLNAVLSRRASFLCKEQDTSDCLTTNEAKSAEQIYHGPVDPIPDQVISSAPARESFSCRFGAL
ncbi:hypothetical protein B932_3405 [Gluconobacter oxydans H24]|nr:hypothetical protein B932_3405 [Gluconobacter oxydans H24]